MKEELEVVRRARGLLYRDGTRISWRGNFVSLQADLLFGASQNADLRTPSFLSLCIAQDVWNISSIAHRLEWMRSRSCTDPLLTSMWPFYASTDIEHFLIELRSILDYAAEIIADTADKKAQIPKDSYRALFQWVEKSPSNEDRLGHDLAALVKSTEWFPDFREVRDSIIHKGGHTLVFGSPANGILFQVLKGFVKKVPSSDYIMYNDNVAYFDRYAALHVSHTLSFLEELSLVLRRRYQLIEAGQDATAIWPGLEVLAYWMDCLTHYLTPNTRID